MTTVYPSLSRSLSLSLSLCLSVHPSLLAVFCLPKDFSVGLVHEFGLKGGFCVQAKALAGSCTSCSARSLLGGCLGNGRYEKTFNAASRVINLLFAEAWIDDVNNAVDRQRRLGNVGADDAFPPGGAPWIFGGRGPLEDPLLLSRS